MSAKSGEKAEATRDSLGGSGGDVGGTEKKCDKKKHWIRIVVKDSDGKPAPEVKPTVEVDGSTTSVTLDKKGKWDTKKTLDDDDDAKITFPDLFDCDWWPDGSGEPTPKGEKDLAAVADGDCVEKLAADAGYRSYKDIWDAPENGTAKTDRPIPNSLREGDVFKGPKKKKKEETKAVDAEWIFIVRAIKKPKLRIVIVDKELKALKGVKWNLTGIASKKGTTGADGLIEVEEIDPKAKDGTLKITPPEGEKFKNKKPSKPKATDPPQYPKQLDFEEFKDEDPDREDLAKDVLFDLKIGSLGPHKRERGAVARMVNLAFAIEKSVWDDNDELKLRVKAFQREILDEDTPNGKLKDIREDLETRHTPA